METVAMIVLYALFETLIKMLEAACAFIANKILDTTITVFSAEQNIFSTFVNLIPFSSRVNLPAIIKGLSYGLVIVLLLISVLKSFVSPLTGDSEVNPAQAFVRAALTMVMIGAIFGTEFTKGGTIYYGGFLGMLGSFFGTVLSKIGSIPAMNLRFAFKINPAEYLAAILLDLALITSIVGAALQYVERIISFAIYIIFGPVAVAMNASKDTADVCKQWLTGLVSETLSIIMSLIMWICFIEAANSTKLVSESLLHYAIMIALLGIMRNSEKIVNAMGFRTISLGDSARAAVAGFGLAASSVMMLSRFSSTSRTAKGGGRGDVEHVVGGQSPYDASGTFTTSLSNKFSMAGSQLIGSSNPVRNVENALTSIKNTSAQSKAISEVNSKIKTGESISAATFNTAMGFGSNTSIRAIGNGEKQDMKAVSVTGMDGKKEIQGYMGDAVISRGNQMETVKDVFFPVTNGQTPLQPGAQFNSYVLNDAGEYQYAKTSNFVSGNGYALDNRGNYAYRTSISYGEMKKGSESTEKQEKPPVKGEELPGRNK